MADWSKLPTELLQLISGKLNTEFCQLRFRSVCSSWRSSSSIPKNLLLNLPSKFPYPSEYNNDYIDPFTSSSSSHPLPPPNSFSLLPKTHRFPHQPNYPISKRNIYLIIPSPNQQHQTLNPWLIKIGTDSLGRTSLWNPLSRNNQLRLRFQLPHHFDFNDLSVFKLGHEFVIGDFPSVFDHKSNFIIKKLVAYDTLYSGKGKMYVEHNVTDEDSDSEGSSEYSDSDDDDADRVGVNSLDERTFEENSTKKVVGCKGKFGYEVYESVLLAIHISGKLAIFRSGDRKWKVMPKMPKMPRKPYTDLCVFNGRPIAVDSTGQTVVVGRDLSLDLVAEAVFGGDRKYLVESDGELLLVDKYLEFLGPFRQFRQFGGECGLRLDNGRVYDIGIERAVRFVVFKLDENKKKWVKLTNLGDRVLFLGKDSTFSVKASDLCMKNGNCVIFRDDDYGDPRHSTGLAIDVFCLDKQQTSPLSDLPCSNLFWPPPQWTGMD